MVNGVLVHKVRIVDAAPTDLTAITDDLITDEVLTRYITNYKPANHKRQRRTNCTFVQKIAVPAQEKEKVDKMKTDRTRDHIFHIWKASQVAMLPG